MVTKIALTPIGCKIYRIMNMVNYSKNRRKGVLIGIGTLIVLFILAALLIVAGPGKDLKAKIGGLVGKGGAREVSFFMDNGRGSYDLVELSIPEGDGPFPVVLMAHGFAGTLHSGGASELGARLAEEGVLACRIDFDPYVEASRGAARTHVYPLSQMTDDAVKLLGIVMDEYGGDRDNVSLYGRSYGGRLVMRMANESAGGYDYKKLALVAPAGDAVAFRRYLGGDEQYEAMKKQAYEAEEIEKNHGSEGGSGQNNYGGSIDAAGDLNEDANADVAYPQKLGVSITPEWFQDVESYDPTEYGWKFGDKPVLLFYNTKDTVVYPDTSIRCAECYKNHEIVEVTTDDGHGYEMGYKNSELKDMIMDRLVEFFSE